MYCPNCGFELAPGIVCCPHCRHQLTEDNWPGIPFTLVRGTAVLMGGGLAFACGTSGVLMLMAACWMLYHYANGTAIWVPPFFDLVQTVEGPALLLGGITAAFTGLLLGMIAHLILQGIRGVFAAP